MAGAAVLAQPVRRDVLLSNQAQPDVTVGCKIGSVMSGRLMRVQSCQSAEEHNRPSKPKQDCRSGWKERAPATTPRVIVRSSLSWRPAAMSGSGGAGEHGGSEGGAEAPQLLDREVLKTALAVAIVKERRKQAAEIDAWKTRADELQAECDRLRTQTLAQLGFDSASGAMSFMSNPQRLLLDRSLSENDVAPLAAQPCPVQLQPRCRSFLNASTRRRQELRTAVRGEGPTTAMIATINSSRRRRHSQSKARKRACS